MTQNTVLTPRSDRLPRIPHAKQNLRDEAERTLSDIAYVLHLTRRIKTSMMADPAVAAK